MKLNFKYLFGDNARQMLESSRSRHHQKELYILTKTQNLKDNFIKKILLLVTWQNYSLSNLHHYNFFVSRELKK